MSNSSPLTSEMSAVSYGSLNQDTLDEITSLNNTSGMLKRVQWTEWPLLKYLGHLKSDGVASAPYRQLTLTHGVSFGLSIQSKKFSLVWSALCFPATAMCACFQLP